MTGEEPAGDDEQQSRTEPSQRTRDEPERRTGRRSFLRVVGATGVSLSIGASTASGDSDSGSTDGGGATLVADRAPDGSRLTTRPDGPVHHTSDGTTHLFLWDEPAPGARAVVYDEADDTDWGGGPDLHVYDTMERPDAEAGDVPRRTATRGQWHGYSGLPELHPDSHSGEVAARVQRGDATGKFFARFSETTEVFLSYCLKIPDGKKFPGADEPGEFPDRSTAKLAWFSHDDWWNDVDVVLPSWAGAFRMGGNSLDLDNEPQNRSEWWRWGEWMRFTFWLECGPDPESDPGRVRFQAVAEGDQTHVVVDGEEPIMEGGQPTYAWKRLNIPGWAQNKQVSGENVEILYDDIYLATGEDANARVELTDDSTYGDSTRMQLCDVQSWSSDRITATLRRGSLDGVESAALHVTTADEEQVVSMAVGDESEPVSIEDAIDADDDDAIDDDEILQAVNYWQEDSSVPGTNGATIDTQTLFDLIEAWQQDN